MEENTTKYGNSTTRKLKDGAVTKEKLAENVQTYIDIAILPVVESDLSGTTTTLAMDANKVYDIKIGTELTITINAPTDTSVTNEYQGNFDTGETAPTITWADIIVWDETPSIEANTHYEFSVRYVGGKYYGLIHGWSLTTEEE